MSSGSSQVKAVGSVESYREKEKRRRGGGEGKGKELLGAALGRVPGKVDC